MQKQAIMTDGKTPIESLFERFEDYSQSTIHLFKLNAIDKSAEIVSSLVSRLAIILSLVLSLLIINIGVALWIGKLLGDSFYGFFIMGGFYALIAIILHTFRYQWIKYPISNTIIRKMLKTKQMESQY